MDNTYAVGSKVVLNSGGPEMMVTVVYPESVLCKWIASDGTPQEDTFPKACVRLA